MNKTWAFIIILAVALAAGSFFYFTHSEDKILTAQDQAAPQDSAAVTAADAKAPTTSETPEEFWVKRCSEGDKPYCEVFQRLIVKENNQRLLEFAVGYPENLKGKSQAALILPLGVALDKNVTLKVDDNAAQTIPYRVCVPEGCLVVIEGKDALIDQMSGGKNIRVTFADGAGQVVNIDLNLTGFGEALAALKE